MSRSVLVVAAVVALFVLGAHAAPLSVRIDDFDFTFDTDKVATYAFNGVAPDTLTVAAGVPVSSAGLPSGEVGSYRYLGTMGAADLLGNAPGFYPVWLTIAGGPAPVAIFGGDLKLDMSFSAADGPYVNPGGDKLDISLTGRQGHLTITGIISSIPPAPATPPITLLDIDFTATSLLGRAGLDVIDLIEGFGKINILLGHDVGKQGLEGVAFMKFFADPGTAIFPDPPGENYDPLVDYTYNAYVGRVSGEAGMGVPEPASAALMLVGLPLLARRVRRKR